MSRGGEYQRTDSCKGAGMVHGKPSCLPEALSLCRILPGLPWPPLVHELPSGLGSRREATGVTAVELVATGTDLDLAGRVAPRIYSHFGLWLKMSTIRLKTSKSPMCFLPQSWVSGRGAIRSQCFWFRWLCWEALPSLHFPGPVLLTHLFPCLLEKKFPPAPGFSSWSDFYNLFGTNKQTSGIVWYI